MLLTRAPVAGKGIATSPLPLDLHVLGLSLAFILSQDQTLHCKSIVTAQIKKSKCDSLLSVQDARIQKFIFTYIK